MFLITGLLIRLILMPLLTYDFDIYHWAVIIQNIDSGNNLYDLAGYYYTPVWGYVIGTISVFKDMFLSLGTMGMTFVDMLPIESLDYPYHIATITSIGFNMMIKSFLIILDLVVGYLIYKFIRERTGNDRKAALGFGLWFFCPIVLYMSSVQGMFDAMSAMLLLLTVFMLYRDKCFFAGVLFGTSVLLKFFPLFCIVIMIGYLYVKHKDDGLFLKKLLSACAGAIIIMLTLMLPQIINGQMYDALSFIIGRAGAADMWASIFTTVGIIIAFAGMICFGYLMFKTKKEDADNKLIVYVLLSAACAISMSITPQYVILLIPFLIIYMISQNNSYRRLFWVVSFAAFASALILNNFSLLCSLSEYTSLISPDWVLSSMRTLEGTVFGLTYIDIFNKIANVVEYAGLLFIVIIYFSEGIEKHWPKLNGLFRIIKGGDSDEF